MDERRKSSVMRLVKAILSPVVAILIVVGYFFLQYVVGRLPLDIFVQSSVVIVVVSIIGVLIGFFILKDTLDMAKRAERLQQGAETLQDGIAELSRCRGILFSNEALKKYEEDAKRIRIISPDLYDDLKTPFYDTILENVNKGTTYEYVIPNRDEVISSMEELLDKLRNDPALVVGKEKLPQYKTIDFPIVTEYVLYKTPLGGKELDGFMEIRVGPTEKDTTNVPLSDDEAHRINGLFNTLFQ